MLIQILGAAESLILAVLILVIAFANRLPPTRAGLAAAVLISAALSVEIYGIGTLATKGERAAATAAAAASQQGAGTNHTNHTSPQGVTDPPRRSE